MPSRPSGGTVPTCLSASIATLGTVPSSCLLTQAKYWTSSTEYLITPSELGGLGLALFLQITDILMDALLPLGARGVSQVGRHLYHQHKIL